MAPEPHFNCRLIGTAGSLSGRKFLIGTSGLFIGRDPIACQVVLPDGQISRVHAWIGYDDRGRLVIRDRKSSNGTWVNSLRVEEQVIGPSDEVAVGLNRQHLFRVETIEAEPSTVLLNGNPSTIAMNGNPSTIVMNSNPSPAAGGTQVVGAFLSQDELRALDADETAPGGTVSIKFTDLIARPHVELIVDKYAVKTIEVPDEGLRIGRDANRCQVVMDHPSISALHAELEIGEDGVSVIDKSTNGTFVNGVRAYRKDLTDGDYITFGRYAGKSLIFRTGLERKLKVEKVDLTQERIRIGRDAANDVVINHPVVSKHHAEILGQDGRFVVVDLGSSNGTFVNGIRIKRHELHDLDRIVIGPSELHFSGTSLSHAAATHTIHLEAHGVSYEVPDRVSGRPKLLLDEVSITARPRELIGLLGPSGAGKSTLMNVLNGFAPPTGGAVLYNDADLYENLDSLKTTIGFVPQEDIMHRQLSVRRCLYYAAKLRLPADLSEAEVNRRVDEMLETLKIDPQRWDNPVSTLSGGQRKRVSIGIELLPKPCILFLDEPTAGLDPRTETLMMMLFRQLANQGSTIVITTHLLASFGVFDRVVVLVQGRLAFSGPGTKFLEYFKAGVPADVYDDLTDNNTEAYALELKKRFQDSAMFGQQVTEPVRKITSSSKPGTTLSHAASPQRRLGLHQFGVLLRRNWELKFGDRAQTLMLLYQAPLVALLVAFMASGPNQIQTIFMAMFAALWFGCSSAVREIVDEQTIYTRERQTGLKIPSYVFAKLTVLAFIALVQCLSVVAVLVFVRRALVLGAGELLGAVLIMFLVALNGALIGLVISAVVSTPEKALTLFPLILIPELLLSGIFLPVFPIQTIVPITIEQLFEGRIYAQPEARDQAQELMKRRAAGREPDTPAEAAAEADLRDGLAAHQVVGAVGQSKPVQEAFQKYTPQPLSGMAPAVRVLSSLAVSRWGLEALSDLCVHGRHSVEDYAYKIVNTIAISLHPGDAGKLQAALEAPAEDFQKPGALPLPSRFWSDKGPYLAILCGHMLVMTLAVLLLMKRKDIS